MATISSLLTLAQEHKDELAIRGIPLPPINFGGDVRAYPPSKLPRFSVSLAIKQVNVDLTTDVLNQLLILQNSFIKVGESITPPLIMPRPHMTSGNQ